MMTLTGIVFAGLDHLLDVLENEDVMLALDGADMDHHVYLLGAAVRDGIMSFEGLGDGCHLAVGKTHDGYRDHVRPLEILCHVLNVAGEDAHRPEVVSLRLLADAVEVFFLRVRPEQRVVYDPCEFPVVVLLLQCFLLFELPLTVMRSTSRSSRSWP